MNQQRDNSGVLFKNDRKTQDNHPDYNGSALIDGVDYWMSAWLKDGQKGKFMSFAFKPKDDQARQPAPRQAPARRPARRDQDDMDDIPF